MKTKNIFIIALLAVVSLVSCTKDGDLVTLDSNANGSDINLVGTCIGTLDENHTSAMALALYWNDNTSKQMQTNYSDVLVKRFALTNYVQLSGDPSFSKMQEYEIDDSCYNYSFSTSELNSACAAIGFEPYRNSSLYVRLASRTGVNIDPTYSNVLTYDVTPYREYGRYLIFDQWDAGYTADKLYPTTDEGIYGGFAAPVLPNGWAFVFFDIQGNSYYEPADQGFTLAKDEKSKSGQGDNWNTWFPKGAANYYLYFNTNDKDGEWKGYRVPKKMTWSCFYMPSITVSGDITGTMVYNNKNHRWQMDLAGTGVTTGEKTVTFSCNDASYYDSETGYNNPTNASFGITKTGIGADGEAFTVNITNKESTLYLDVLDPLNINVGCEEVQHTIYIGGLNKAGSESWDLEEMTPTGNPGEYSITKTATANCEYGCIVYVDGWEGDKYPFDGSGNLQPTWSGAAWGTPWNWGDNKTYKVIVNLNALTWKIEEQQ